MTLRLAATLLAATLVAVPHDLSPAAAQQRVAASPDRDYRWIVSGSSVQDQNFYLLTLLGHVPDYRAAVSRSRALAAIGAARAERVASLLGECGAQDARCRIEAMLWQGDEIAAIGEALATDAGLATLAPRHLRPSGAFARHAGKSDGELVRAAWADAAAAINRIYRVYGLAEAPRYPKIDSGDFDPVDPGFGRIVAEAMDMVTLGTPRDAPVFAAPLEFALTLLYLNERELVRRTAPMELRENAAAAAAARSTDWANYPYPAILVLGNGPDAPYKSVGNFGKLRTLRAAQLWREGKAPFIIVSGGAVHPAHTDVFEAVGMKQELVERYGVPASAVLIDPSARHTTTNFRNAARLMFRYGLPMDRPSIVTSSRGHIASVIADGFRVRLQSELGYQPIERGKQLGPYEMEFRPLQIAMHRDPMDPLDP